MLILYNTGENVGNNNKYNSIGKLNRALDMWYAFSLYNKVV